MPRTGSVSGILWPGITAFLHPFTALTLDETLLCACISTRSTAVGNTEEVLHPVEPTFK